MITLCQPLPCGNAVRLAVAPPAGARLWRLLRRTADAFTGPDDAAAVAVGDDSAGPAAVVDHDGLVNGATYVYRAYFLMEDASWLASASASAIPAATYDGGVPDIAGLVRQRLEAGLAVEVARGALSPAGGSVALLDHDLALETAALPAVAVSPAGLTSDILPLGGVLLTELATADGEISDVEGGLPRHTIRITGQGQNAAERDALRAALVRLLLVNQPVFEAAGLSELAFRETAEESTDSGGITRFLTRLEMTCLAPVVTQPRAAVVVDVDIALSTTDS